MSKYLQQVAYHITTNTEASFPFFEEDIFCNVFLDDLVEFQPLKNFNLIALKINPDHLHLIIQAVGKHDISQIMGSVKRVSSEHINQILETGMEINRYQHLDWKPNIKKLWLQFWRKNNWSADHNYPRFKWQNGFFPELIKTPLQLERAINYLKNQHVKHELTENKFLYVNPKMPTILFPDLPNDGVRNID